MKNLTRIKNILFAVTICLVIALGVYSFTLKRELDQKNQVSEKQKEQIQTDAKIISRKIDKQGLQHATIQAAGNIVSPSDASPAVSIGILDTTAMAIGILKKQVENLTIINSTLKAENLKAVSGLDEKKKPVYKYTDRYLSLNYRPGDPVDTTDKGTFDFKYNADLTITQYWKRNKVLGLPIGSKNSLIDIYSNDPRTIINGVKKLTVKQEQPFLGLRIQGVSSYDFNKGLILPGGGIQMDLGRFSINGTYLYDAGLDNWIPAVTGRYDLIRF